MAGARPKRYHPDGTVASEQGELRDPTEPLNQTSTLSAVAERYLAAGPSTAPAKEWMSNSRDTEGVDVLRFGAGKKR